ncbi:heme A synthase [Thalassorhabdus alkalitolerans]|uniref:Heme A synthase n=1 Tax=Thalassorhabdus alkalitolerans TaxID=2282697 RepID=A0ABW0YMD7_9BACI
MNKGLKIYGVITSIGMLIVLLQGALVTKTESGDGCGSTWPLCFGEVVPTSPAVETIIEYSHRLVSGLLGIMVIILAFWAWKKIPHIRETKFMAIMAVLFIIFQGLMGAAAVVWGHSDIVLALHFGISAISFATVVLLTVLAFEDGRRSPAPQVTKGFRNYLIFVLAYCYAAIYTGAYVKHSEATYACQGFPLCNGQVIPDMSGSIGYEIGIHFAHRIFGMLLFVFLLILMILAIKHYSGSKAILWSSILAFILVIGQITAGVSILFADSYLTPALFHAMIISLLFTVLSYMVMISTRKPSI